MEVLSSYVTFIAILNGTKMIVTTISYMNDIYMYQELFHKIDSKNAVELCELGLSLSHGKTNKKKIKKEPVKYMGKLSKMLVNTMYNVRLAREDRYEKRQATAKLYKFKVRRQRELTALSVKEEELFKLGYLKDKASRKFYPPGDLLKFVSDAIQKKMAIDPIYLPEDKVNVTKLVMGNGELEHFDKYKELFYNVSVIVPLTKQDFKSSILGDSEVFYPETIIYLQARDKDLS